MKYKYDFLIVGAGLTGATLAERLVANGRRVLVIESRDDVGGNVSDTYVNGILRPDHGGHILHTDSTEVWRYLSHFAELREYRHRVAAVNRGQLYSFPLNLLTYAQVFGVSSPLQAKAAVLADCLPADEVDISTVEGWCLANIGRRLYELFIRDYTSKQWGRSPADLPSEIIRRLPIRYDLNDRYFSRSKYEGLPRGGYSDMVRRMLETVEVRTGVRDYVERRSVWDSLAEFTIFTGQPDVLFGFEDGRLDYRSLEWRYRWMDTENYQGGPTVNYTDDTPFTRILEYRHFMEDCRSRRTLIGLEYPLEYHENAVPYYPINDEANNRLYRIYQERAAAEGIILAGRLGRYRYLDMDQAVGAALRLADLLINKKRPPLFGGGPDGD